MTRKRTTITEPKVPVELLIPRDEAKSRLQERMQKGSELKQTQIISREAFEAVRTEYNKWNSFNTELFETNLYYRRISQRI